MTNDPYAVLGIPRGASAADIKQAYRRLAMKYHPDRNPGDKRAEETFKAVKAAYDQLTSRPTVGAKAVSRDNLVSDLDVVDITAEELALLHEICSWLRIPTTPSHLKWLVNVALVVSPFWASLIPIVRVPAEKRAYQVQGFVQEKMAEPPRPAVMQVPLHRGVQRANWLIGICCIVGAALPTPPHMRNSVGAAIEMMHWMLKHNYEGRRVYDFFNDELPLWRLLVKGIKPEATPWELLLPPHRTFWKHPLLWLLYGHKHK